MAYVLSIHNDDDIAPLAVAIGATKKEAKAKLDVVLRPILAELVDEDEIAEHIEAVKNGEPDTGFLWFLTEVA